VTAIDARIDLIYDYADNFDGYPAYSAGTLYNVEEPSNRVSRLAIPEPQLNLPEHFQAPLVVHSCESNKYGHAVSDKTFSGKNVSETRV
jgi:hypothetical protein